MGWTKDQEKAIYTDTGSGNLLVSAAAGSGKTAVLVERVLQKILSGKSTIDRLLVVTFTEAAASEMQQKIIRRLSEYLQSDSAQEHEKKLIKNQIRLAQTADIMTIDGFCNRVVLNNFHILGIDLNIQICDDAMGELLVSEALENVYSNIYKSDDEEIKARFKRLTDYYAKDRNNDGLSQMIHSVYSFTEPFADPQKWLAEAVAQYDLPVLSQAAIHYHMEYTQTTAERVMAELDGVYADDELLNAYMSAVYSIARDIRDTDEWDGIYEIYTQYFSTTKQRKEYLAPLDELKPSQEKNKVEFAAKLLYSVFYALKTGRPVMGITQSEEKTELAHNSAMLKAEAEDIAWIVSLFIDEFDKVKASRNLYQFSDIEHLTYKLFNENETVRNEYRDRYDEILIDEYQDTNMLQDTIFKLISHNNIFMVGDLKQSIYRFRKGDPYIFKDKAADYELADNDNNRIILSQNFRSRVEVLRSVNDIFTRVMSESAGDVNYSGGELIVRDDEFEYYPEAGEKSELHYLAVAKNSELDRDLCEARYTARKIKELLDSDTKVYDKSLDAMRHIMKRDIVILENSLKYNAEMITEELSRLGIDSYIDKSSFFDRREVSIMLSLISVIDNAHQDIPLISVLRSPIGGFTDDELAIIRIHGKSCRYFIDALYTYSKDGEDLRLRAHCYEFVRSIARWRDYVRKKSVAQLIWTIYEETYFFDMMGAIEEGEEAQTNLRLLYERAKQYESAGFKGLFNFIKYIDRLKGGKNDIDGAKLVGENHDVVRIMTIHKSKGLEFPYVFLLGAGRDFRTQIDYSAIKMHKTLYLGLPYIFYDKHYSQKTRAFDLITQTNKAETMSERMRLLYVALTRPREKLYVVMAQAYEEIPDTEDIIASFGATLTGDKLLPGEALAAKGFYSWICPAVYASPDTWRICVTRVETELEAADVHDDAEVYDYSDSVELRESVYKILDYKYPHYESYEIPTRTSVTQLKELAIDSGDNTEYEPESRRRSGIDDIAELMFSPLHAKPRFMLEDTERPANEIGTLYHLVMSEIDINKIKDSGTAAVSDELLRLVRDEVITAADLEYIDANKIKGFFESDLARRMMNSTEIRREQPFQINIPATMYDASLSDLCKDDTLILQGVIDCFFMEEDGYVLLDYKTDKVKNGTDEIRKRYQKQLELYKRAIEELTKKPVKESILYLFDTGETV